MSRYLWQSASSSFDPERYIPYPVRVLSVAYDERRQRLRLELDFPGRSYKVLLNEFQAFGLVLTLGAEPVKLLREGQEKELSDLFSGDIGLVLFRKQKLSKNRGLSLAFGPNEPQILELEE